MSANGFSMAYTLLLHFAITLVKIAFCKDRVVPIIPRIGFNFPITKGEHDNDFISYRIGR